MSGHYFSENGDSLENGTGPPVSPSSGPVSGRNSTLSNKLTAVLSRSYTDPDIRGTLSILGDRGVVNDVDTRRGLRLEAQKEIIECNGAIVQDFGLVAEVLYLLSLEHLGRANTLTAVEAHWCSHCGFE
jgi:conserved oligomeric Golgi complex subunit 6